MSYLNQAHDPRRRATAITGVIIVHAAMAFAVVVGLTVTGAAPQIEIWNPIPLTPDPQPTPPPPQPQKQEEAEDSFFVAPTKPIDIVIDPPVLPTSDITGDTFVIDPGKSIDPVIPPDPPRPAFLPRNARPSNDPSSWLSTDDYPAVSIRGGDEGVAGYRLIVGTNGRVSACDITRSTGTDALDAATCKFILRRARFESATDDTGAKVVGSYTGTVKWELPD